MIDVQEFAHGMQSGRCIKGGKFSPEQEQAHYLQREKSWQESHPEAAHLPCYGQRASHVAVAVDVTPAALAAPRASGATSASQVHALQTVCSSGPAPTLVSQPAVESQVHNVLTLAPLAGDVPVDAAASNLTVTDAAVSSETAATASVLTPAPFAGDAAEDDASGNLRSDGGVSSDGAGRVQCPICQEHIDAGDMEVTTCNHAFHRECIQHWDEVCTRNSRDPHCPTCRCPRPVLLLARGRSSSDTTSVSQQRRRDAERLFRELEARRMAIDGVRGNVFENSAQPRCGEYYSFGSTRRPSDTPGASHGEFEGWGQNHRPEHKTWWSRWLSAGCRRRAGAPVAKKVR